MINAAVAAPIADDVFAQNACLMQENALLKEQIAVIQAQLDWFMGRYKLARMQQFAASSERSPDQLLLLDEAAKETSTPAAEPVRDTADEPQSKGRSRRKPRKTSLPVEVIKHELAAEEQVCPQCSGPLHLMSTETRREFVVIPPQVKVVEHEQCIYACRHCEREGISTPVIKARAPVALIPGSPASASVVAYVMNAKYTDGMPLARQEQHWKRLGIDFSRQTLANWVIRSSEDYFELVYERLKEFLLAQSVLFADESSLQVLKEPGRDAQTKSYMWLYRSGRDGPAITLFDYQMSRARKHPEEFLSGFKGYLHVDGYSGYEKLKGVTLVGCLAHARRKFSDAIKVLSKDKRMRAEVSLQGLGFCNRLFAIERELKDATAEERFTARLERSRPVLDEFKAWLETQSRMVLPKGPLGQAVRYCLNQWSKLEAFMLDGRLEVDNNRSERAVKMYVVGRKNWLFCNTPKGARASAVVYSIVETAKENGLIPFEYLRYLLEQLPNRSSNGIGDLLPWSETLPLSCRLDKQI